MPAYHSAYNGSDARSIGGMYLLPLKTKYRGPAPVAADPEASDIIDEVIDLFRANCLFRNFEVRGDGDRLLIYGILYLSDCLTRIASKQPAPSKQEAQKLLQTHALGNFAIPGDATFSLNAVYSSPSSKADADVLRQYLQQFRQEFSDRLVERLYADGQLSKWWMSFQKRKFMGKTL
ncbi:ARP2 3 complex 21 kDa subunit [Thamnocephalis sphaerospora]|uniref:Actin-related protein 2/3 complex subunit 3 n=1 Tax=Thamnocephalis sphaerospora TaxID=78915 RepID=A0A4V1IWC5_9FUNG|nr:ARP2 3 complex 21 kDa subunit [Thamnocephalis sphaerospora]|eukprot:RKP07079.1 ARP2 3 complex 21 kDa subunit [Thamnocephalis sphaerospora]